MWHIKESGISATWRLFDTHAYAVLCWQGDKERELEVAQQEVVALRARVQQLESDTHSSSSLELKNLSLQQV